MIGCSHAGCGLEVWAARSDDSGKERDFLKTWVGMALKRIVECAIIILRDAVSRVLLPGSSVLGFCSSAADAGQPMIQGVRYDTYDSAWHRGKRTSKSGGKGLRFEPQLRCNQSQCRCDGKELSVRAPSITQKDHHRVDIRISHTSSNTCGLPLSIKKKYS